MLTEVHAIKSVREVENSHYDEDDADTSSDSEEEKLHSGDEDNSSSDDIEVELNAHAPITWVSMNDILRSQKQYKIGNGITLMQNKQLQIIIPKEDLELQNRFF